LEEEDSELYSDNDNPKEKKIASKIIDYILIKKKD
jgi:hypothetical protein